MNRYLIKIVFVIGIAVACLGLTGFQEIQKTPNTITTNRIPKEKKELLNRIVGRWITQTTIHARKGKLASTAVASDTWQWSPDGNFLLHMAYGIREQDRFGAMQVTGYNPETGDFDIYNFNQDGSITRETLVIDNNIWIWTSKEMRSTGIMDEKGKVLTVKHEMIDGKTYEVVMNGVLTKCADY